MQKAWQCSDTVNVASFVTYALIIKKTQQKQKHLPLVHQVDGRYGLSEF